MRKPCGFRNVGWHLQPQFVGETSTTSLSATARTEATEKLAWPTLWTLVTVLEIRRTHLVRVHMSLCYGYS